MYFRPHDGEVETKHIETKPLENLSPTKEKVIDETLNVPQVSNEEKSRSIFNIKMSNNVIKGLSPEKPRETATENIEEYKKESEIHVQKDLKQEAPKENPIEKGKILQIENQYKTSRF